MANPQKENGYTSISNEILEKLYSTQLNASQFKIVLVVLRYTYGFQRKQHNLSETFISKATGISKRYVSSEINKLINNNLITVIKESTFTTPRVILFNKNYEEWLLNSRSDKQQVNNTSTVDEPINTTVEQSFNTTVEQLFHQEIKLKENINKDYVEIFNYYLTLNLTKHKTFTDAMKKSIEKAMKNNKYTVDNCKELLKRHEKVVEITKKLQYPVRARGLDVFFGQKVMNANHLICSEYDEGGKYYEIHKQKLGISETPETITEERRMYLEMKEKLRKQSEE